MGGGLPALQVVCNVGHFFLAEGGVGNPLALLRAIVFQQAEGVFAQQDDGDEVADGHHPHEEVGQVPHCAQAGYGAEENHGCHDDSVDGERPGFLAEVLHVGFAIVVVAQHAAVGKEEDGYGYCNVAPGANLLAEGKLGQFDAIGRAIVVYSACQDDEGCAGADDESIAEHADGLYFALFHRVGDIGRGCYVGG